MESSKNNHPTIADKNNQKNSDKIDGREAQA